MTFTLTALKHHPNAPELYQNCFCYTDDHVTGEPLVHQTTDVINQLFTLQGLDAPDAVRIEFCTNLNDSGWGADNSSPEPAIVYLNSASPNGEGTLYITNPLYPQKLEDACPDRDWETAG